MSQETKTAFKYKLLFRLLPVMGVVCIVAGIWLAIDKMGFNAVSMSLVGLGALLFLTLFVKAEVANIFYYLHVFGYSALVGVICVAGYLYTRNHSTQLDLTAQKFFSLSDQSRNVVKGLKQDVNVTFFAPSSQAFQEIVDRYESVGNERLKFKTVDAIKDPLETRKWGDNIRNGEIVIKSGQKEKRFSLVELQENYENTLTNALVEVTRDKEVKLYFLKGHGEVAFEQPAMARQNRPQPDQASLAAFKNYLTQRAMKTEELNLAEKGFVPQDASLVVIAGPAGDLLANEKAALEQYLAGNGKLLVLLDVPRNNFAARQPNLMGLLEQYGVAAPDKIIVDLNGQQLVGSPVKPLVSWLNESQPITRDLSGRMTLFFLGESRPIEMAANASTQYRVTDLLKSSPKSWSIDLATALAGGRISPPTEPGAMTPQPLGVAVSQAGPVGPGGPAPEVKGGMRMVVYGTSDLIQDRYLASSNTAAILMLNTINWLTEQEDQIAVMPKQLPGTPIVLSKSQLQLIFFLAAVLVPAGLFFGGVSYSLLRRRR